MTGKTNTAGLVFLLGGQDLEMETIRGILDEQGIEYVDKGLKWGARLSDYQEEIARLAAGGKTICAVELKEDMAELPANYVRIDHHGDRSGLASSLEQVASLLGMALTREQQLVAVNDRDYIPGLVSAGATADEIGAIRAADRKAQGVTAEEEQAASDIAAGMVTAGGLTVVKTTCKHFSPICDRLYPRKRLLVYNDCEWTFYGKDASSVYRNVSSSVANSHKHMYRGGGDNGYVGVESGVYTENQIKEMAGQIKEMFPYSYHVFYFPFSWIPKGMEGQTFSDQVNLDWVKKNADVASEKWERVQYNPDGNPDKYDQERRELFGEMQYYFEFVHDVLYDKVDPGGKHIMLHYERREPKEKDVTYNIQVKEKRYKLKVDAINLNFFSTGVGVLSFFLKNLQESQSDEYSIRDINQYGRRIMPPHAGELDPESRTILPKSISIKGLKDEGRYADSFESQDLTTIWKPTAFITRLIGDLAKDIETTPVVDDRMLVNCWYGNDEVSGRLKGLDAAGLAKDKFWYKFLFVDEGEDDYCQNQEMKAGLIAGSTYKRWQGRGSLYGVTRYSMVFLTNSSAYGLIGMHSRTIYSRMFELVTVQRASVLRFAKEVTQVSNLSMKGGENKELMERIKSLYKEYIRFVNQIYFTEVTAQDQGIELYDMLLKQFSLNDKVRDLDNEIGELYQYGSLQLEDERKKNGELLNLLAIIFLPATLFTGIFGMNGIGNEPFSFWIELGFAVGVLLLFAVIAWPRIDIKHLWKWLRNR